MIRIAQNPVCAGCNSGLSEGKIERALRSRCRVSPHRSWCLRCRVKPGAARCPSARTTASSTTTSSRTGGKDWKPSSTSEFFLRRRREASESLEWRHALNARSTWKLTFAKNVHADTSGGALAERHFKFVRSFKTLEQTFCVNFVCC